MNRINKLVLGLSFVAALSVNVAAACPVLEGNFQCTVDNIPVIGSYTKDVAVSQSDSSGVTTYVIDGAPVIADGRQHHADRIPALMAIFVEDVNYTAECSDNSVSFNGDSLVKKTRERGTTSGSLTQNDAGHSVLSFTINTPSKGEKTYTGNCVRK